VSGGGTAAADPYAAFRAELIAAGLLAPLGPDGLYGRSAVFEGTVDAIERMVTEAGADQDATFWRFPPVVPRWVFDKTDYLRSFPDLTGAIHTFKGDDRAHAAILAAAEAGEDWSRRLEPAEAMLCPAVCHPLYPTLTGRLPAGGSRFNVYGWCYRHEPSVDPARMQAFRQREYVFVGEPAGAEAHRDLWIERGRDLLSRIGLPVEVVVANDPFFGRVGRMLAANQRDEELKFELVVPICSEEKPTAIMSSNCHREHFGAAFGIETPDGEAAHSACVGFGVERITLALLRHHGLDPEGWPASVRRALWP